MTCARGGTNGATGSKGLSYPAMSTREAQPAEEVADAPAISKVVQLPGADRCCCTPTGSDRRADTKQQQTGRRARGHNHETIENPADPRRSSRSPGCVELRDRDTP